MIVTIAVGLLLLILLFLIYGIHVYILDKRYRLPPGPPPLPFIGNILSLRGKSKSWIGFRDLANQYGSIFTFYMGQYRMVILAKPDVIREAIVNNAKLFSDRPVGMIPGFEKA